MRRAARRSNGLVHAAHGAVGRDVDAAQLGHDGVGARGVRGEPCAVHEPLVDDGRRQRRDQPRVGAGPHLQVDVGQIGGFGAAGVDDDEGPPRIAGDLLQRGAGPGEAVALPGVLPDEQGDLAALHVAPDVGPQELAVDPELAGLLLGQRVRAVAAPERVHGGRPVGAAEVVPLPATAEVEDALATMGVAHRRQPTGDLANGGVPVDHLEAAVGAPAQRMGHPLTAGRHAGPIGHGSATGVLVVVEAERLLARVALRRRMALVASDALEPPGVLERPQAHLDAAVAFAEDAGRLLPHGRVGRRRCLGHSHGGNVAL